MTVALVAAELGLIALWSVMFLPPLHPAQLWAAPWAAAVGLFAIRLIPYRPIATDTCWLIALSVPAVVAASVLGSRLVADANPRLASPVSPQVMEKATYIPPAR